jgi:succinate dehydrogenase / fumarate reductase, cytochrome b subunit
VSVIELAFLSGLLLVLAAVVAFSTAVLRNTIRGGRAVRIGLAGRGADHSSLGRAAFLAHRLTGFGIFAFLCLHILDVGLYSVSHRLYDEVQPLYGSAPLRVLECGLLFAILFHTGNGLRLLAVDLVPGLSVAWARRLLQLVIAVGALGGLAGSALILTPLFQ